MNKSKTAKVFKNGSSQAVRLPAEFRFRGKEVFVTRDESTGDVILSANPGKGAWRDFFALPRGLEDSPEFMAERPMNRPARKSGVFDDSIPAKRKAR
jgi:antitoxin VapB